jgi:hypothetical protein
MATKKDLRMYRTATSYEHNNNLGAEAVGVNRLEHLFIGGKRSAVNGIGTLVTGFAWFLPKLRLADAFCARIKSTLEAA